jgi:hypothetical protein
MNHAAPTKAPTTAAQLAVSAPVAVSSRMTALPKQVESSAQFREQAQPLHPSLQFTAIPTFSPQQKSVQRKMLGSS